MSYCPDCADLIREKAALAARVREIEANNALMLSAGVEQERELIVAERRAEQAEAALSVAQKDAERMNWLDGFTADSTYCIHEYFSLGGTVRCIEFADADDAVIATGATIREAIDKTMQWDAEQNAAIAHGARGRERRMGAKSYHMGLSVRGALTNMTKRELAGMFTNDEGRTLTADEARTFLFDQLAKGHEVIPCSPKDCPDFDCKGGGCPGHAVTANEVADG